MIVLCTVPHTGTQFFRELLKDHYAPCSREDFLQKGLWVCHVTDDALNWIECNRHKITLVTTIRDWDRVEESWRRRGKSSSDFADYVGRWLDLLQLNPIIVSVDSYRENRLKSFEQFLGVELKTGWTPVNAWSGD